MAKLLAPGGLVLKTTGDQQFVKFSTRPLKQQQPHHVDKVTEMTPFPPCDVENNRCCAKRGIKPIRNNKTEVPHYESIQRIMWMMTS